jgi:hypothetical protein
MRTAMQLMLWYLENEGLEESGAYYKAKMLLDKEKEQIQNVFEHCWNHPNWNGEYDIKDMEDYLKNYNQNNKINKMETPLQNLKNYFRNNDTITKEELNNAIEELYDNERSAIMDAAKKFANTLGIEDEDILDYYNDLYKTN